VLALPAGLTVMRFLPPLVIAQADLARAADAVEYVLTHPIKTSSAEAELA
jgi:acetylornithine/succinyldiaminopimelate/putrescine aminotransferase